MGGFTCLSLILTVIVIITGRHSCNGKHVAKCSASDLEALMDFRNGFNDPENRLSSWEGTNCCQWRGIQCNNVAGTIVAIDLHNPFPLSSNSSNRYGFWNLSGEIRSSLTKLKYLEYVDLSLNTFDGIPVPEFIGSLRNLRYLNLSKAGLSGAIPHNLGNLSKLQYLDLSSEFSSLSVENLDWMAGLRSLKHLALNEVDLSLVGVTWLDVFNKLPSLTELYLSVCGLTGDISSLNFANFSSLSVVDLSLNSFGSRFPDWFVNISTLSYVDISYSGLYGRIPLGLGELPNLRYLNLEGNNNLSASCREFFAASWAKIEVIDLAANKIHGKLPDSIGNLTFLTELDLLVNSVDGGIPSSLGRLCNLEYLDVSGNNLNGTLPKYLRGTEACQTTSPLPSLKYMRMSNNFLTGELPEWLGQVKNLVELSLNYNSLRGNIPESLGTLQNLTKVGLGGNELNGTLPTSLGRLSQLSALDVSFNHLDGLIWELHFLNLTKLQVLQLSSNSFVINISSNWVPTFQVTNLGMASCHLGPLFPSWLQSQQKLAFLDLSNASLSGSIPYWFWDVSSNLSLLNVSHNHLSGQLPKSLNIAPFADVDLSSNLFEGSIPLPSVEIELLDLSENHFSGPIPQSISSVIPNLIYLSLSGNRLTGHIPASIGDLLLLQVLDFSKNSLSGSIPSSIGNCSYLKALDLSNNNLSGEIPATLGQLIQLQSLHLKNNKISGQIPSSFQNLSSLETLDLGNNELSGIIPPWVGDGFLELRILRLRSNDFIGELPSTLSNLSSLQVLDLANNNFAGGIPKSLGDFKAMARAEDKNQYLFYGTYRSVYYEESLVINVNARAEKYTKTLSLVTSLDLSSNNLSGNLPEELTSLSGLRVLNLSRNHIIGHIPESISRLRQLLSLDLSANKLSGAIPSSMSSLTFLGYLNMSNNNFSGMVPYTGHLTTFDASSFTGNPGLCGSPLPVNCQDQDSVTGGAAEADNGDDLINQWFFGSLGVGFAAGILVPFFILLSRKPWSDAYFSFTDRFVDKFLLSRKHTAKHREN